MNTGGRILNLVDRLGSGRGPEVSMVKLWADVFELDPDSRSIEDDVVTCLQATRSELEMLRSKLAAIGVPEALMQPGFDRLRNVTSATHISGMWNHHRDEMLRPENRLAFMWANWALQEEDEDDIPVDEMATLREELDSLEESLLSTEMTPYLKGFIQRQIDAIRAALRVYRVRGVKPIEEALHTVAGAYAIEKSRVEGEHSNASDAAKSVFERAIAFIEKTAKVADSLDKIRKSGEGAYKLATSVGSLLLTYITR